MEDGTLSIREVQERLRLPARVVQALLASGLLGCWENGRVPVAGVENFERYGTQWRPELGQRRVPHNIFGLPLEEQEQPFLARLEVQISSQPDGHAQSERDTGWIAQFYLRPNTFFFADPGSLALVGPVGLRLDTVREVPGAAKPTYLYPDPEASFAMLMVVGGEGSGPAQEAFGQAYDIATPVLDQLAFSHDYPLPVAHTVLIGVPSGVITLVLPKPQVEKAITTVSARGAFEDLADATALYREGISGNSPFSQFLALWKAYENAIAVRGEWRRRVSGKRSDARSDVVVAEERFPRVFAFGGYENLTFGQAKERLRASHRNAVAHGMLVGGKPHTAATSKSYMEVATAVPLLRYMAHTTLRNVQACLASATQ